MNNILNIVVIVSLLLTNISALFPAFRIPNANVASENVQAQEVTTTPTPTGTMESAITPGFSPSDTPTPSDTMVPTDPQPTASEAPDSSLVETLLPTETLEGLGNSRDLVQGFFDIKASPRFLRPNGKITLHWELNFDPLQDDQSYKLRLLLPSYIKLQEGEAFTFAADGVFESTESLNKTKGKIELATLNEQIEDDSTTITIQVLKNEEKLAEQEVCLVIAKPVSKEKGGEVSGAKDKRVKVIFPPNTLPEDADVVVMDLGWEDGQLQYGASDKPYHPFKIEAYKKNGESIDKFESKVEIEYAYDPVEYDGNEQILHIEYFDEENMKWVLLPSYPDTTTKMIIARTDHFTVFNPSYTGFQAAMLPTMSGWQVSEFTGAATYDLPLTLPDGPGGFQPSLNLSYNSQIIDNAGLYTQASWVGMGWELTVPFIQRNMRNTYNNVDDDFFTISFNGVSGILIRGTDGYWHTEDESFARIELHEAQYAGNSWWEVWMKDGTRYEFGRETVGQNSHANYTVCWNPGSTEWARQDVPWRWGITKAVNIYGKEIIYYYDRDGRFVNNFPCGVERIRVYADFGLYPKEIRYPNNQYRILFNWDTDMRRDYLHDWWLSEWDFNGQTAYLAYRLNNVETQYQSDANGTWSSGVTPIRKYSFGYANNEQVIDANNTVIWPNRVWDQTPKSGYPLSAHHLTLKTFQESIFGNNAWNALPAYTFNYGTGESSDGLNYPNGDGQHLYWVENGRGGRVEFTYSPWAIGSEANGQTFVWNDANQEDNWKRYLGDIGWTVTDRLDWFSWYNGTYFHPGAMYEVNMWAAKQYGDTAPTPFTVKLSDGTGILKTIINGTVTKGDGWHWFQGSGFLSGNASLTYATIEIQCGGSEGGGAHVWDYQYRYLPTFYRVKTKKTINSYDTTRNPATTINYVYEGGKVNSPALDGTAYDKNYMMNPYYTQFRGHAKVTEIYPDGHKVIKQYHQNYPRQGLMSSSTIMDNTGKTYSQTLYTYDMSSTPPVAKASNFWIEGDVSLHWNRQTAVESRIYNGSVSYAASLIGYGYDINLQGSAQYGNVTTEITSTWDGSSWQKYRAVRSRYFPNVTASKYIVGLPGYRINYICTESNCAFNYDAAHNPDGVYYLYDGNNTQYDIGPTYGVLTAKRTVISNNYSTYRKDTQDETYTYDNWGNLTSVTQYTGSGYFINYSGPIATTGLQTTTYCYGSTDYNTTTPSCTADSYGTTLKWEKNAAGQVIRYYYDNNRPWLLTGESDSNQQTTNAEYDPYGRLVKIILPGDDTTYPSLRATYGPFSATSYDWVKVEQKIANTTYQTLVRLYNGLGELKQTQTKNVTLPDNSCSNDVNTNLDVCTVVTNNREGWEITGYVKHSYLPVAASAVSDGVYISNTPPGESKTINYLNNVKTIGPDGLMATSVSVISSLPFGTPMPYILTQSTDAAGNATNSYADVLGRMVLVSPPIGSLTLYNYDILDRSVLVQQMGRTAYSVFAQTSLTYDLAGRKLSMNDPDMGVWSYQYDALGNLITQTDARGCSTALAYDALNRLTGKTLSGCGQDEQTITFDYDETSSTNYGNGHRTRMSDASGSSTAWEYDQRGRVTTETKVVQRKEGSTITPLGTFVTRWAYLSNDQVASIQYPGGNQGEAGETVTNTYNSQGNINSVTGATTYLQEMVYDEAGRLVKTTLNNVIPSTTYSYLPWGAKNPDGSNALGQGMLNQKKAYTETISMSDTFSENILTSNWTLYNPTAGPTYRLNCLSDVFLSLHKTTSIKMASMAASLYTPTPACTQVGEDIMCQTETPRYPTMTPNPTRTPTPICTTPLGYLEISVPNTTTYNHSSTLNQAPQVQTDLPASDDWTVESKVTIDPLITSPSGFHGGLMLYFSSSDIAYWGFFDGTNLALTRNDNTQLISVTNTAKAVWLRIQKVGVYYSFEYKLSASGTYISAGVLNLPTAPVKTGYIVRTWVAKSIKLDFDDFYLRQVTTDQDLSYTYDAVGNILSIVDQSPIFGWQKQTFTYDSLNRLTGASTSGNALGGYNESYGYDPATGNLITRTDKTLNYGGSVSAECSLKAHAVNSVTQGGQTLANYCYDANGNMTQRIVGTDTYTLTYNGENQLSDVTGPASLSADYGYDADGQRSWSDMNGVVTVYVGNYYEWNVTTGSGTSYYYAGSMRLATRQETSVSWLLADHLGSANTTMDSTGTITGELRYLPWGETRYTAGTTPTDRRYTGQIEEPELGLYFYNARWYDPALGRFAQPDSLIPQPGSPLGWDRYAYTLNNPVNRVDPTGHKACDGKNNSDCEGFDIDYHRLSHLDVPLTEQGKNIQALYTRWVSQFGYLSPQQFFGWMMAYEMNGLQKIRFDFNGFDISVGEIMSEVVGRQLWADASISNIGGHPPYCRNSNCTNGLFNFMGTYMQVAISRANSVLIDPNNYPTGYNVETKAELLKDSNQFTSDVLTPQSEWLSFDPNAPYHWGNNDTIGENILVGTNNPNGFVYQNGTFIIYTVNQSNCFTFGRCQ